MKKEKFFILPLILLGLGVLVGCAPKEGSTTGPDLSSPHNPSEVSSGGESGGGGSTLPKEKATPEKITENISNLKKFLPGVLYRFEWSANRDRRRTDLDSGQKKTLKLYSKLIKNEKGETVYQLLPTWNFVAKPFGACKDLHGSDSDASAFGEGSNDICFSVERLSQKLTSEEAQRSLIALAIHEISHRMGIGLLLEDHADSVMLQTEAEKTLPLLFSHHPSVIKLDFVPVDVQSIAKMLDKNEDQTQICMALSYLDSNVDRVFNDAVRVFNFGIAYSPKIYWRLMELNLLVKNAGIFCDPTLTERPSDAPKVTMKILMDGMKIWPDDAGPDEDFEVKSVVYDDRKALKELLPQILEILKRTKAELLE